MLEMRNFCIHFDIHKSQNKGLITVSFQQSIFFASGWSAGSWNFMKVDWFILHNRVHHNSPLLLFSDRNPATYGPLARRRLTECRPSPPTRCTFRTSACTPLSCHNLTAPCAARHRHSAAMPLDTRENDQVSFCIQKMLQK
jgi:hypothetical protein